MVNLFDSMEQKQLILAGLSGASAYFAHEWAHDQIGSEAIREVTYVLGAVGFVGILLNEFVLQGGELGGIGDFQEKLRDSGAYALAGLGAGTFALIHEATHGELLLDSSLAQSSYYLAGATLVGFYIHEYAQERLD